MKPYSWQHAIIKSDLPATTKLVLLALSCHVSAAGESAYPSEEMLAKETGLSRFTVIKHLQIAVEHGWLKVTKHGFADQRWARNEYYPQIPEGFQIKEEGSQTGLLPQADGSQPGLLPQANEVVKEVDTNRSVKGIKRSKEQIILKRGDESPQTPLSPTKLIKPTKAKKVKRKELPDDWEIPEEWIEAAARLRPDLTVDEILTTARVFKENRRSRGIKSQNWFSEWKAWILREHKGANGNGKTFKESVQERNKRVLDNWAASMQAKGRAIEGEGSHERG